MMQMVTLSEEEIHSAAQCVVHLIIVETVEVVMSTWLAFQQTWRQKGNHPLLNHCISQNRKSYDFHTFSKVIFFQKKKILA